MSVALVSIESKQCEHHHFEMPLMESPAVVRALALEAELGVRKDVRSQIWWEAYLYASHMGEMTGRVEK